MFNLALAYSKGKGTAPNPKAYAKWTRRAAETGDPDAIFNLSLIYAEGGEQNRDDAEYFEWTLKAAQAGHAGAMFNLGQAFYHGRGTYSDLPAYLEWTEKAAQAGHMGAMFNLSLAYRNGTMYSSYTAASFFATLTAPLHLVLLPTIAEFWNRGDREQIAVYLREAVHYTLIASLPAYALSGSMCPSKAVSSSRTSSLV